MKRNVDSQEWKHLFDALHVDPGNIELFIKGRVIQDEISPSKTILAFLSIYFEKRNLHAVLSVL